MVAAAGSTLLAVLRRSQTIRSQQTIASYGGGVYSSGGSPTISNNTISGNAAPSGGGINLVSSLGTIANNTITGNTARRCQCLRRWHLLRLCPPDDREQHDHGKPGIRFFRSLRRGNLLQRSLPHDRDQQESSQTALTAPMGGGGGICCSSLLADDREQHNYRKHDR